MDFADQLQTLASRIRSRRDAIKTEEAAKTAFVLPFIQALGYDIFDPSEVTPELCSSVGTKNTDRVDYAIMRDGEPIVLIECKSCGANLDAASTGQLLRYFHGTKAQFAILTDGIIYKFYTDLDSQNLMDQSPFLVVNMLEMSEDVAQELKRFTKGDFDVVQIQQTSRQLKAINHIKKTLIEWMESPSDDFVKSICSALVADNKKFTAKLVTEYKDYVSRAFTQVVNDKIGERLKFALNPAPTPSKEESSPVAVASEKLDDMAGDERSKETFSEAEIEALLIVKSIVRQKIDTSRLSLRQRKNNTGILLDGSQKKPVCRVGVFDIDNMSLTTIGEAGEVKHSISSLDDIYKHADEILSTVSAASV